MSAVYAMADYPRGRTSQKGRGRTADEPTQPPPIKIRPPMHAHLAVPGTAECLGSRIEALPENLEPGTVAEWVSCAVCDSGWHPQRGHEGGVLMVRRWNSVTGVVRRIAAACRCPAGARLGLISVTDREWRRAVASRRRATRLGVNALTDEVIMRYLITPRGQWFQGQWGYYAEAFIGRKVRPDVAFRRAYVKVWQQAMR